MNNMISKSDLDLAGASGLEGMDMVRGQAEEMLVTLVTRGDLDAFNELVLRYQDMVYRHACFYVGDPDLAEDVVQESLIRAFKSIGGFHGGSFRAWLLRIVRNVSFDHLRRSRRHSIFSLFPKNEAGEEWDSPSWLADPSSSVQEAVERDEMAKRLAQTLEELPPAFRTIITLIDLFEQDYQEAAQILQVPIGTIKSRLARARMHMREKLIAQEENAVHWVPHIFPTVC